MLQYVYFILLLLSYLYCKLQLSACDMDYKAWRGKLWAKGERRKPYEKTKHFVCKLLDDGTCVFAVQGLQAFLPYLYDLAGS
jgi:hypothetical protein